MVEKPTIMSELVSKTGMTLDGILGSAAIDSSGEILNVKGADISDWERGRLLLNWEHFGPKTKDHIHTANDIVGKVVYAKKIFKAEDCETDRQKKYWDKIQLPFIYGVCRLFDKAGHANAQAIAAIIRDNHANGEPLNCEFSVEGHTLKQEGNILDRTIIKKVAITVSACNKSANGELLADPAAPQGFDDKPVKDKTLEDIVAEDSVPFKKLGKSYTATFSPILEGTDPMISVVKALFKAKILAKAMEAGFMGGAPSSRTQGAALQREDGSLKSKAVTALNDYTKKKKDFDKTEFRATLKASLPEADEDFLDYFTNLAEDAVLKVKLKKTYPSELMVKMENLTIRLKGAISSVRLLKNENDPRAGLRSFEETPPARLRLPPPPPPAGSVAPHKFNGKGVWPGEAKVKNVMGRYDTHHIVGEHENNLVVVPNGLLNHYTESDVKLLPKGEEGKKFVVTRPATYKPPTKAKATNSRLPLITDDQKNMLEGLDLGNSTSTIFGKSGVSPGQWIAGPHGKDLYVKEEMPTETFTESGKREPGWEANGLPHPDREHIYHNAAHEFFGLGQYVTPTVSFNHPDTGRPMIASQKIDNMEHYDADNPDPEHKMALNELNRTGELDKLGLMNLVMGNQDRHRGNFVLGKGKDGLKLLDHGLAFETPSAGRPPRYWELDDKGYRTLGDPINDKAKKWLLGLDSTKFNQYLLNQGVPSVQRNQAVNRLVRLQATAQQNPRMNRHLAAGVAQTATETTDHSVMNAPTAGPSDVLEHMLAKQKAKKRQALMEELAGKK